MNLRKTPFWILIGLIASGCQLLPDRAPSQAVHDFGPTHGQVGSLAVPWSHVSVDAPDWLQDPSIRYRLLYSQPTQVRFYSQARWIAPPPELLANRLGVARADSGVDLKIALQSFEQVFDRPRQSSVVLQIHAQAVEIQSLRLLGSRGFRWTQAAQSGDARGAVAAFSDLLYLARSDLSVWVHSLAPPGHLIHLPTETYP